MIYVPLEFIKAWVDMPRNVEPVYVKDGQPYQQDPILPCCPMNMTVSAGLLRYNNTLF